jgi:PTH2 family peptidyl-tRNA hydrolase
MADKPNDPWKTESGSRIKAWFVMRLDLPMSQGKFGIQIGHGTDFIHMIGDKNPHYADWINPEIGNRRKIALRANSLAEIEKVQAECEAAGMITMLIKDAGLTEFGQATITGLVVLPHDDALIPKVLKRTQSWKPTDGNAPVVVPA